MRHSGKGLGSVQRDSAMKWWGVTLLWAVLAGVVVAAAIVGWRLSGLPYLDTPDKVFYDLRFAILAKSERMARPEFAIVSITDRTLDGYPAVKPVDRGLLARLVTELRESGAVAAGLTFQFDRPSDRDKDAALIAAIQSMGERIAVGVIDARSGEAPENLAFQTSFLSEAPQARQGHIYFDGQKSGVGQQPDLAVRFLARRSGKPGEVAESFAESLLNAAGVPPRDVGQTRVVPATQAGPHIAWTKTAAANGARAFTTVELPHHGGAAAVEPLLSDAVRAVVRGKIVIIGADVERNDRHLTPFSVSSGERMTSAEIHAQIAAQLKDGRRVATVLLPVEFALAVAIATIAFFVGYVRGYRPRPPHSIWGNADYFIVGIPLALIAAAAFGLETLILPTDTMLYSPLVGIFLGHFWYNRRSRGAAGNEAAFRDFGAADPAQASLR